MGFIKDHAHVPFFQN